MKRPSFFSRVQGPIQAFLRPAMWVPGMRNLRYHWETWTVNDNSASQSQVFENIMSVMKDFQSSGTLYGAKIVIGKSKISSGYMRFDCYTEKTEWLDVVEIKIRTKNSKLEVYIRSWSSGFIPTSIPLAPVLNCALFFFPFSGHDPEIGWTNSSRITKITQAINPKVPLTLKAKA